MRSVLGRQPSGPLCEPHEEALTPQQRLCVPNAGKRHPRRERPAAGHEHHAAIDKAVLLRRGEPAERGHLPLGPVEYAHPRERVHLVRQQLRRSARVRRLLLLATHRVDDKDELQREVHAHAKDVAAAAARKQPVLDAVGKELRAARGEQPLHQPLRHPMPARKVGAQSMLAQLHRQHLRRGEVRANDAPEAVDDGGVEPVVAQLGGGHAAPSPPMPLRRRPKAPRILAAHNLLGAPAAHRLREEAGVPKRGHRHVPRRRRVAHAYVRHQDEPSLTWRIEALHGGLQLHRLAVGRLGRVQDGRDARQMNGGSYVHIQAHFRC
mmetsp:Transcript_40264/g.121801  ORF Transcript_40264/g.121801 Transcript_40264/m.121801 type:complete len:322 (-) Transcript_40264:214-1179(-)